MAVPAPAAPPTLHAEHVPLPPRSLAAAQGAPAQVVAAVVRRQPCHPVSHCVEVAHDDGQSALPTCPPHMPQDVHKLLHPAGRGGTGVIRVGSAMLHGWAQRMSVDGTGRQQHDVAVPCRPGCRCHDCMQAAHQRVECHAHAQLCMTHCAPAMYDTLCASQHGSEPAAEAGARQCATPQYQPLPTCR
jgi:hypothetical protein